MVRVAIQSQMCWYVPVIPALGSLKQEDFEFDVSLGYTARLCLKTKQKKNNMKSRELTI
jgi:hypothetical protein